MKCNVEEAIKEIENRAGKLDKDIKVQVVKELESILETKPDGKLYNTQYSTLNNLEEFDNELRGIENDPSKMVELLDMLQELDNVGTDDGHSQQLKDVLNTFVDAVQKFIPEMAIKLKEKYEGDNAGSIDLKRGNIYLGVGTNQPSTTNRMSMAETFVHEIIHAATEYAYQGNKGEVAHTIAMINRLYAQASKQMKAEYLLPEVSVYGREADMEHANEILDYVFNRDTTRPHHGVSEFIAYALTNKEFMNALSKLDVKEHMAKAKSLTEQIHRWFKALIDWAFGFSKGARGMKMDEAMMKFAMELSRANNMATKEATKGIIVKATEAVNKADDKLAEFIENLTADIDQATYPELFAQGKYVGTMKAAIKVIGDKEAKNKLMKWLDETKIGIFDYRNTFQSLMRDFRDSDAYDLIIQKMGYRSNTIEREKRIREVANVKLVKEGFGGNKLDEETDIALGHAVVETDMSSLSSYSDEQLMNYLKEDDAIDAEVARLKGTLSTKFKDMAEILVDGLGQYMATHTSNVIGTMLNTNNIVQAVGDMTKSDEKILDKMASLMAIKYTAQSSRDIAASTIETNSDGVRNIMMLHDVMKTEAQENLFSKEGDYPVSQMIQGYTQDITNPDYDTRVAPANMVEEMLKEGYRRVQILSKSTYDSTGVQMALYVSNEAARQPWHRGVINIADKGRRGTTLTDIHVDMHGTSGRLSADNDISKYNKAVVKAYEAMRQGKYKKSNKPEMLPVLNMKGEITDARYTMSKLSKVKYLQRDSKASAMIAKTDAASLAKYQSEQFNIDVVDMLIGDMVAMKEHDEEFGWVEINPDSTDEEIREMYKVLPEYLKRHIKDEMNRIYPDEGKKLWVRKDVYRQLFGYRGFTLDTVANAKDLYRAVRYAIRMAEKFWKNVIKMFKVDIIIKTPAVLIQNVISNFLYSMMVGIPLTDVYRQQMDAVEALAEYQQDQIDLDTLKIKEKARPTKQGQIRIRDLERKMKDSPINDMMEAGMFTAIVEDMEVQELEDPNRLARMFDSMSEKLPSFIRTGLDYAYLTKRTPIFKYMTKATQYSDFVARYALINHYTKLGIQAGLSEKEAKEQAMSKAIEAFINYDLPDSRGIQYLNDMGMLMFTKYLQRIQRVIRQSTLKHPIQFISAFIAQATLMGASDITDSALFISKNPLENIHLNPLDPIKGVLMPSGIEALGKAL